MLQNPPQAILASHTDSSTAVKRYATPNQRNRSVNRRKSGDRVNQTNNLYGNDIEKGHVTSLRNIPSADHGDAGSSNCTNENRHVGFVPLEGCCRSTASRLLNDRWTAAMYCYNDPSVDSSDKPVVYSGGNSAWGQFRLPHQIMAATLGTSSSGSQMDFLGELSKAMHNANSGLNT